MIKYHYLVGGILSTLIAGAALPLTASATATPGEASVTIARPSIEDLQSAITKLESTGLYRAYFINKTAPLDANTPFYTEYNYLNRLVNNLTFFINYYEEMDDEILQDAILASDDAVRGCTLMFNAQNKPTTPKTEVTASTTTNSAKPAANVTTTSKADTKTVAGQPKTTTPTVSQTTPSTTPAIESTADAAESTPVAQQAETEETSSEPTSKSNDIAVPATGEVEETGSPLPLFVAIVAGAAAASILIAAILHRQPKSRF